MKNSLQINFWKEDVDIEFGELAAAFGKSLQRVDLDEKKESDVALFL